MEIQHKNMIRGWEATTTTNQQQQSKETVSSAPSSPSHEFSFTISLISSSTTNNKPNQPLAIDLTPADDIFFHGHLLPLHQDKPHNIHSCICSKCDTRPKRHSFNSYEYTTRRHYYDHTNMNNEEEEEEFPTKERVKAKTFSLFGRARRPKQGESRCEDQDEKHKKKLRFDHVSHFVKKYITMFSKGRIRTEDIQFRKQPYSFSGKLTQREADSMRTNPANLSSDSTMEELQAAIQAAIAHCKNSIGVPEKL